MRYVWISFVVLAAVLVGVFGRTKQPPTARLAARAASELPVRHASWVLPPTATTRPDSIVGFAMRQLGTNYCYAGSTPTTGFDCSGFVQYVFSEFGIAMPHSTSLLISVGRLVPRAQSRRGDIVVFTGTAATATTPGHAGIVVSEPGQPLRFIHSSSARREPGVKISQVEGTDYERRFMAVRRVL